MDHKKARAAEKQALAGGHLRIVHPSSWVARESQPTILDQEAPYKAKHKKGCKRNHGGLHVPIEFPNRRTTTYFGGKKIRYLDPAYICKFCGKHGWDLDRHWEAL